MPTPALDKVQLLDGFLLSVHRGQYLGGWVVHLPAVTPDAGGDGAISEIDFAVAIPSMPGHVLGFEIGVSDNDPSHFAADQVIDSAAPPAWLQSWSGAFIFTTADWLAYAGSSAIVQWDGSGHTFEVVPQTFVTVDAANSDPNWDQPPPVPTISSAFPDPAPYGYTITIFGTGLAHVDEVVWNVTGLGLWFASPLTTSPTSITVTVSFAGFDGTWPMWVRSLGDTSNQIPFTVGPLPTPIISGFNPARPYPGDTALILGSRFTGVTDVKLAGVSVAYTFIDDGHIRFAVPLTATPDTTIAVSVTNAVGTTNSVFWVHGTRPEITSISPDRGTPGTPIDIYGTGFTPGASVPTVTLGSLPLSLTVVSDTHLRTVAIPDGVSGGWFGGSLAFRVPALTVLTANGPVSVAFNLYESVRLVQETTVAGDIGLSLENVLRLDAAHLLVWGVHVTGGTVDDYRMAVVDVSDPLNPVTGTPVSFFGGASWHESIANVDVEASPTGNAIFAVSSASAGVSSVSHLIRRFGMTLTVLDVQTWAFGTISPHFNDLNDPPVWMSETRLLTGLQATVLGQPGVALWAVGAADHGLTAPLWYEALYDPTNNIRLAERIDDTHIVSQQADTGAGALLRLSTITDSGRTDNAVIVVPTGETNGLPIALRQETGRPGWFRGYDYLEAGGFIVGETVYEYHLDPVALTATGGAVDELAAVFTAEAGVVPKDAWPFNQRSDLDLTYEAGGSGLVSDKFHAHINDRFTPDIYGVIFDFVHHFIHAGVSLVGPAVVGPSVASDGDDRILARYTDSGLARFAIYRAAVVRTPEVGVGVSGSASASPSGVRLWKDRG